MAELSQQERKLQKALRRRSTGSHGARRAAPVRRRSMTLLAALSTLLACPAFAAKWDIVPWVTLDETWTDNVRLSAPGTEQIDWVTTLTPAVSVRGRADRLRVDVVYEPQLVSRANEGSRDIFHRLDAVGVVEFVKRTLFLEASSRIVQTNISALGPLAESNVNVTGNRETTRTSLINPVLRHDFGLDAQLDARLLHSIADSDASAEFTNFSNRTNGVEVKLKSGPAARLLTWNAAYSRYNIDFNEDAVRDVDTERISVGVKRLITRQVGLLANVGYEDNDYLTTGPAPEGPFWSAGAEWIPSPRTRLSATAGRNYDGPTAMLDFSHCTRLSEWTLKYSQDLVTTRALTLDPSFVGTAARLDDLFQCTIRDPLAREIAVNTFIDQNRPPPSFGTQVGLNTSVPYLQKRWQGSVSIRGVRNTLLANLFTLTRDARGPTDVPGAGDFAVSPEIKESGASMLLTSRLTPQTTSSISGGIVRTEFVAADIVNTQKFVRLSVSRNFQPRISGTLSVRRVLADYSTGAGYAENAVSVLLSVRF